MKQYVDLVTRILEEGKEKKDRTGVGTISIFGHQSVYDMKDGFPLLTLKKTHFKSVAIELLWFLGNHMKDERYQHLPMTNTKYLKDNSVSIWDEWADEEGNLGPVYGQQWVDWRLHYPHGSSNQIKAAIIRLMTNPEDRGNIVSAWNVGELSRMALRPCHTMFQFYADELTQEERVRWFYNNYWETGMEWLITLDSMKNTNLDEPFEWHGEKINIPKHKLSLQLYQRSADTFLGVPFNIASYSLLLHMIAHVVNMVPGKFVHTFGDAHLYLNHKEQVSELLQRTLPKDNIKIDFCEDPIRKHASVFVGNNYGSPLPFLKLNPEVKDIFDFKYEDISLENYHPFPVIKAPIAI